MQYVLAHGAEHDLDAIWDHIGDDSPDAADVGSQRSSKPLKQLQACPQRVEIVAIPHGARDIPSFLAARTL